MRKYYLFIIKHDIYHSYYSNPDVLYRTLENLFYMKCNNVTYGLSIYDQICQTFNTSVINNYFHTRNGFMVRRKGKKVFINNYKDGEKYILEIRHSCLIIYCDRNLPKILKLLNYYNPRIFVCDFFSKDYFWNNTHYKNIYQNKQYNVI